MLTRAKSRVEKSIEAQAMDDNWDLTKPGPSTGLKDKESPSSQSFSGSKKPAKRKSSGFVSPAGKPKKTKKIYSSSSLDSSQASGSHTNPMLEARVLNRIEAEMEEEKDQRFEQM